MVGAKTQMFVAGRLVEHPLKYGNIIVTHQTVQQVKSNARALKKHAHQEWCAVMGNVFRN
jgi:hypothetical protein